MKLNIKNWRDNELSELEKAKMILADKNTVVKQLSEQTGLKYQSLVNYRQNLNVLDNASWKTVNKLAQAYDANKMATMMSQEDFFQINTVLKDMFKEWQEAYADFPDIIKIADTIETIISTDPNAMYFIYQNLLENKGNQNNDRK
ncbi:MAG: hypothetical protein HDS11_04095 [Bacteroides sp.]|nr:hypothetical protein [Bacteroides sp.]